MLNKFYKTCILAFFCVACTQSAWALGVASFGEPVNVNYWVSHNKNGDKVILNDKGIDAYNARIRKSGVDVVDLLTYPNFTTKENLRQMLNKEEFLEDDLYLRGNKVSDNYKNILRKQVNLETVGDVNKVRYAVTVRRAPMRTFPTGEAVFYEATDTNFDVFQDTMLDPAEPVIVLHKSANGYFYFVQSVNYAGWVSKFDLAFAQKDEWLSYAKPQDFLVVVGKEIKIKTDGKEVLYQQGARLPIVEKSPSLYKVNVPVRTPEGYLVRTPVNVYANSNVHEGYLPYTSNNIITAAFKFYGEPYGWGGLKDSVDCSSLIYNVYRTVGIVLPRNADMQLKVAGSKIKLEGVKNRALAFNKVTPGAVAIFNEGDHIMMYLGDYNGTPHFIHSLSAYMDKGERKNAMRVLVSDASLKRASGKTYLEHFDSIVEYK